MNKKVRTIVMALIFEFPSVQKLCIPVSKIKNIKTGRTESMNTLMKSAGVITQVSADSRLLAKRIVFLEALTLNELHSL